MNDKLQEQLNYLNQEINNIEQLLQEQLLEKEATKKLLEDLPLLNDLKEDQEIIVPVAKGIFLRLTIKEFKSFVVNVGNNVLLDKNLEEVKTLLNENLRIIEDNIALLKQQHQKLVENIKKIYQQ
ncbi:MAG: prefoldin subunit alpha [Candidatus Woesearchaeota archaeon]